MQISLNQVAPLQANAGLQQTVNVTQSTDPSAGVQGAAAGSALTATAGFTGTILGVSLSIWIFGAAVVYFLFFGGRR